MPYFGRSVIRARVSTRAPPPDASAITERACQQQDTPSIQANRSPIQTRRAAAEGEIGKLRTLGDLLPGASGRARSDRAPEPARIAMDHAGAHRITVRGGIRWSPILYSSRFRRPIPQAGGYRRIDSANTSRRISTWGDRRMTGRRPFQCTLSISAWKRASALRILAEQVPRPGERVGRRLMARQK